MTRGWPDGRLACAGVRPGRGTGAPGLQEPGDGLVPGLMAPPAAYFAARSAEEFPLDVAMAWAGEARGFLAKEQAGTLKRAGDLPEWNKNPGLLDWLTSP